MPINRLAATEPFFAPSAEMDPRLLQLARDYLAALNRGDSPLREDYLVRYPDLREVAGEYLDGIELAFSLQGKEDSRDAPQGQESEQDRPPIGDFQIVGEIGRGGMGIVYEAIQLSLGRKVALKVLPFAAALDDRHRKRFLLEAQAAAQLHHNHIVPVYAVGCERGTHYYAMQLIDGRPISAELFLDCGPAKEPLPGSADAAYGTTRARSGSEKRQSQLTRPGEGNLNRFQRIATLIADVASGLEYAHSCGIVHRDIKPANLLLDALGKIWIADFGLAQITAGEHVTQTGDMLGTIRYMSPEQASGSRGVVDHRSDVYSLGATLYELLTSQPVFEGRDRQTLLHQVLHEDPKPLRQHDRSIPEELEIITLKALRHTPSERYETALHFADDLRRYLTELPISARRPTYVDLVRKWTRRHPTAVLSLLFTMAVSMLSLALTIGIVAHQKALTQESLEREQVRAVQAENRLATAQAAADEMIRMAENEFTRTPMEETLRLRLLSSALSYYQNLLDDPDLLPALREKLTQTRDEVAQTHRELQLLRNDKAYVLLRKPDVRQELGLTEEQCVALENSHAFELRDLWGSIPVRLANANDRQQQVFAVLDRAQQHRLEQVALQMQGPSAILESVFSGQLELTDSQTSTIQSTFLDYVIQNANSTPPMNDGQYGTEYDSGGPASFHPDQWLDPAMKRELLQLILQKLTPQQRARWRQLAGPAFGSQNLE